MMEEKEEEGAKEVVEEKEEVKAFGLLDSRRSRLQRGIRKRISMKPSTGAEEGHKAEEGALGDQKGGEIMEDSGEGDMEGEVDEGEGIDGRIVCPFCEETGVVPITENGLRVLSQFSSCTVAINDLACKTHTSVLKALHNIENKKRDATEQTFETRQDYTGCSEYPPGLAQWRTGAIHPHQVRCSGQQSPSIETASNRQTASVTQVDCA